MMGGGATTRLTVAQEITSAAPATTAIPRIVTTPFERVLLTNFPHSKFLIGWQPPRFAVLIRL